MLMVLIMPEDSRSVIELLLYPIFTERPIDNQNLEKEMLSLELLFKVLVQVMHLRFSDLDLELVI